MAGAAEAVAVVEKPPVKEPEPFLDTILADLGVVVGEAPKPEPPKPEPRAYTPLTIGEASRIRDEQKKMDEEAAKAEPPVEKPAEAAVLERLVEGATPPALTPEAPKPEVSVTKKKPVEEIIRDTALQTAEQFRQASPAPPAPAAPEAQAAPAVDAYESTLTEAQREELELARFAAVKDAKHKDLPAKLVKFYKDFDGYVQQASQNPERTLNDSDEEFQKWIAKNRPGMDPVERRKLERLQIKEEAKREAAEETRAEMRKLEERQRAIEVKPQVEAVRRQFVDGVHSLLLETNEGEDSPAAPIVTKAMKEGWDKAAEENQVHAGIVKGLVDQGIQMQETYSNLIRGLIPFDPNNQNHQWLIGFTHKQGEDFKNAPPEKRVTSDGRTFLPVAEYNALPPAQAARHWTFSERDILTRLAHTVKQNANARIKSEEERLTKSGYIRPKATEQPAITKNGVHKTESPAVPAPPSPAKKEEQASPKSTPTTSPGPAKGAGVAPVRMFDDSEYAVLGLPKVV